MKASTAKSNEMEKLEKSLLATLSHIALAARKGCRLSDTPSIMSHCLTAARDTEPSDHGEWTWKPCAKHISPAKSCLLQ